MIQYFEYVYALEVWLVSEQKWSKQKTTWLLAWDFLLVHSKSSSFLETFTFHFNGARTATQQLSSMEPDLSTIPNRPKTPSVHSFSLISAILANFQARPRLE